MDCTADEQAEGGLGLSIPETGRAGPVVGKGPWSPQEPQHGMQRNLEQLELNLKQKA